MAPSDPVNHPSHYTRTSLETIDVIEDMVKGWPSASAYRLGNVLKYIWRHRDKGDPKENLKKALWYLQRELDALEPSKPADALGPCTVPACGQPASVRVHTYDGITQSCFAHAEVPRCSAPGCLALTLPFGAKDRTTKCYRHMWGEPKPVEVAKPLEQRSVVVEPLPPEKHNNLERYKDIKLGSKVRHKLVDRPRRAKEFGIGEVMSRGLDGLLDVQFQGARRWVHEDDLELA
jgi:hypothetical protein